MFFSSTSYDHQWTTKRQIIQTHWQHDIFWSHLIRRLLRFKASELLIPSFRFDQSDKECSCKSGVETSALSCNRNNFTDAILLMCKDVTTVPPSILGRVHSIFLPTSIKNMIPNILFATALKVFLITVYACDDNYFVIAKLPQAPST